MVSSRSRVIFTTCFVTAFVAGMFGGRLLPGRTGDNAPATGATAPAGVAERETPASPPSAGQGSKVSARRSPEEIAAVKQQIDDATLEYSEETLPQFELWLADSDAGIRAAAIEGLLQSGLPGGVRLLRAAAAAAKDPAEAEAAERAAAILELPPATPDAAPPADRPPAKRFNMKDRLPPGDPATPDH